MVVKGYISIHNQKSYALASFIFIWMNSWFSQGVTTLFTPYWSQICTALKLKGVLKVFNLIFLFYRHKSGKVNNKRRIKNAWNVWHNWVSFVSFLLLILKTFWTYFCVDKKEWITILSSWVRRTNINCVKNLKYLA